MIISIKHQTDSTDYQKSNQYNVFYRSIRHYKASINTLRCCIVIKFKNKDSAVDWLDKYMLEFVEFQTYMIKFYGMTQLEVEGNDA